MLQDEQERFIFDYRLQHISLRQIVVRHPCVWRFLAEVKTALQCTEHVRQMYDYRSHILSDLWLIPNNHIEIQLTVKSYL